GYLERLSIRSRDTQTDLPNRAKQNRPPDRGRDAWAAWIVGAPVRGARVRRSLRWQLESPVDVPKGANPLNGSPQSRAQPKDPGQLNAHSPGAWGSGLVQHVFRLPARSPAAEPSRRVPCAAPPSEKRYSFSRVILRLSAPLVVVVARRSARRHPAGGVLLQVQIGGAQPS